MGDIMNFSERLKELRESKMLSQEILADELGIPRSSIGHYESGENDRLPRRDRLDKIASYFNVSVDYLLGRSDKKIDSLSTREPLVQYNTSVNIEIVQIPIYGEIKAGYDSIGEQNVIGYEITSRDSVSNGDYFYLIVKGDSMIEDGIIEGCKVLVRRQSTVSNGKVAVVLVNDEEATLKRVFYDGDTVILQAANKRIPPKTYDISDIRIQGQVKSYVVDL